MYAVALSLSALTVAGTTGLPYFHLGSLDVGIPIQSFGVIVAAGVLIGAALLRRYGEWHGVSDEHIRGLTGWITVTGFIGAHVFDVLAYQWNDFVKDPILILQIWKGISSYGGFIGGGLGFFFYVWWKRLPHRLMSDMGLIGLLVAFSIGRIGCTVVSDHIGGVVDPSKWYAALAMDYPRHVAGANHLFEGAPNNVTSVLGWNLGFLELLYLIPVNAFILWYGFRSSKRPNAGLITVFIGMLYAPVRFFMDFLRPENSDPRYLELTFAQWASILAFGATAALAVKMTKGGKPAETVTKTSGEAQRRLKMILKEDDEKAKDDKKDDKKADKKEKLPEAKAKVVEKTKEEIEDEALAKEAEAAKVEPAAADEADDDEGEDEEEAAPAASKAAKPAQNPSGAKKSGGGKKKKKKR